MDKYLILIVLNVPFVIFGIVRAITMYKNGITGRLGISVRILFWLTILAGLVFAQELYDFLNSQQLTDTAPLSLADVVLVTGINFCLFLCIQIYARLDLAERRLNELHEELSVRLSKKIHKH